LGDPPPRLPSKKMGAVQWLRPDIIGRVSHLHGEEMLRHAKLVSFEIDPLSEN